MDSQLDNSLAELGSKYKRMTKDELATEAVRIATLQLIASSDFKKPRMTRISKYYEIYDGKTAKKLRQLFNVAIPIFPGMVDTLNALYDTPIRMKFKDGDPSDYFKAKKVDAAFQMEVMDTSENTKWDSKLRLARFHAIMTGRAILKYSAQSDPTYSSSLDVVNLKNFHFQPRGGLHLENHLFAGEEKVRKTQGELLTGAESGIYDKKQVQQLIRLSSDREYLPFPTQNDTSQKLSRFKPLGLDPDNASYVGQTVYELANWVIELDGTRYYVCFHPWSKTWLRFEKWKDIDSSDLYPWKSYATHEDDENFLSKSYADDLYPAADAIVAMFNQELTNREKRNFGARAYDKDMVTDVRKFDEAMHRPDALVPMDTKGGTRRISEGVYEFKVGELNGTVNLIDWVSGNLGRNVGATDLSQGSVQEVSKKASVTFAEQKSVSKRLSWAAQPFQTMMADLGKAFIYGLKDHMPSKMAIRIMGETGMDWEEITRLDLNTKKDLDILISSTDKQKEESELRSARRKEALLALAVSPNINSKKRDEEILRLGEYGDEEVAEFLDIKTFSDKKSLAKASEAIQFILRDIKPDLWYGATTAFMQKIVDFANDKRTTLKGKYIMLIDYAMAHQEIVAQNLQRKAIEDAQTMQRQQMMAGAMPADGGANPGIPPGAMPPTGKPPGGISRAMNIANAAV